MAATSARNGLLLWLACLTTAVVVPQLLAPPVATRADQAAPLDAALLADLQRRLGQLEQRVEQQPLERWTPPAAEPLRGDASAALDADVHLGDDLGGLLQRLARLEGFEQERQDEIAAQEAERLRDEERQRLQMIARRDRLHATILDPTADDLARADAWRDLRRMGDGAWNDAVILEMTRIGAESTNDRARELAWIGADGQHTSPLLVEPLMRAATADPVAAVREEAVDALGRYGDHPGVVAALRAIAEGDAHPEVREEARRALERLLGHG